MHYLVTKDKLNRLISELLDQKYNVVCESKTGKNYTGINIPADLKLSSSHKPSNLSIKEFFFPRTEPLFFFKRNIDGIELIDPPSDERPTVFIGVKPCDAAALPVMNKVFNWDYKDEFFNRRLDASIIIGMECKYSDDNCFCTSVGLSPVSEKGSDLFLYEKNDSYIIKAVTSKGEEFINKFSYLKESSVEYKIEVKNAPPVKFEYTKVKDWLDKNFNSEFWNEAGELCLGCAQCAFVCPACHCFDIVDEDCSYNCGRRVKNWDACQFGLFTKHASGHNPREDQEKRYRQRVSHKFKYYQDRFNEILCTGCGRCIRGCPASIDISDILVKINSLQ